MCLLKDKQRNRIKKIEETSVKFLWGFFLLDSFFLLLPSSAFCGVCFSYSFDFFFICQWDLCFLMFHQEITRRSIFFIGGERCKETFALIWNILEGFCYFFACECYWCLRKVCFSYNKWVKKQRKGFHLKVRGLWMLSYGK